MTFSSAQYLEKIRLAVAALNEKLDNQAIDVMIMLGSGLGEISSTQEDVTSIEYSEIPGLVVPEVTSHKGQLIVTKQGGQTVAYCYGRCHLYEGHSAQEVAFLIYVLRELGASQLIVTNASGALNELYKPGDIMVIEDHLNLTGQNPVVGLDDTLGQRFTDMSQAYNPLFAANTLRVGLDLGLAMHLGIYAGVLGPTLETSAERRMLSQLGADAVGMSTVNEVIAANHCGMQVIGLSAITNMATGKADQKPDTIENVLENASVAAVGIEKIVNALLES